MKDVALTFSLNDEEVADVGDAGAPSSAFFGVVLVDTAAGGVAEPFPLLAPAVSAERFPLKGGIIWMIILFGAEAGAGVTATGAPHFSSDGTAYAYVYVRTLSEAYVVTGLK